MNKIIEKDEILYLTDNSIDIDINNKCKVVIYHLVVNSTVNVNINLNSSDIDLEYHFSTINYDDNNFVINVNHKYSNTTSNIYNHGVNVNNNRLHFDVNGYVPKDLRNVTCNQENQIINICDGKSTINPNLFIDSYDAIANHAAYIGKFKDEVVFYLESRGINKKKVYNMLMKSFLIPNGVSEDKTKDYLEIINNI